jgi:hypothetical protein
LAALSHLSHTPALFALGIFWVASYIYAWAGMDCDPLSMPPM